MPQITPQGQITFFELSSVVLFILVLSNTEHTLNTVLKENFNIFCAEKI